MATNSELRRSSYERNDLELGAGGIYIFENLERKEELDPIEMVDYLRRRIRRLEKWGHYFEKRVVKNYLRNRKNAIRVSTALMRTQTDIQVKKMQLRYWQKQAFSCFD